MIRPLTALPILLALAGVAHADRVHTSDPGEVPAVKVRVDDLALDRTAGATALHRRIDLAVARVCDLPSAHRLAQRARVLACVEATGDRAHREADRLIGSASQVARTD